MTVIRNVESNTVENDIADVVPNVLAFTGQFDTVTVIDSIPQSQQETAAEDVQNNNNTAEVQSEPQKNTQENKPAFKPVKEMSVFTYSTVPGNDYFFSTETVINPVQFEEALEEALQKHPLFYNANSYRDFLGSFCLLHNMGKIAMRRGFAHTKVLRKVLMKHLAEHSTEVASAPANFIKTGDPKFDDFYETAVKFNWGYESTDSRSEYAMCDAQLNKLMRIANEEGGIYITTLKTIADKNGVKLALD